MLGCSAEDNEFPYRDRVPGLILPYLNGWNDVRGDGNCGFRCVANAFHGNENEWPMVRRTLFNEINSYHIIYRQVYFDGLVEAINRINWRGASCGEQHYMECVANLFPIANFYRY